MLLSTRRKKPEEYSTNPNTVRARARKAKLDPYTREMEQANASDTKAIARAWTIITNQQDYKDAPKEVREKMLQQAEKEVMERRRRRGLDKDSKIERFLKLNATDVVNDTPSTSSPVPGSMQDLDNSFAQEPQQHTQPVDPMHSASFTAARPGEIRSVSADSYGGQSVPNVEGQLIFHNVYLPQQREQQAQTEALGQDNRSAQHLCTHDCVQQINQTSNMADSAVIASLQATVQRQEQYMQQLAGAIHSLANDVVLIRSASREQEARVASMESQMKIFYESSSRTHDPEAAYARQVYKLEQVLSGIQRITSVTSEVCNSFAANTHGLSEGRGVGHSWAGGFEGVPINHGNVEASIHHPEGGSTNTSQFHHSGMVSTKEKDSIAHLEEEEEDSKQSIQDISAEN
ncbi:hypothetical protein PFICI_06673 [Pestalotiopsis fici W106-1]|uniref:Uncharacterized protein n=1 Tax=Pestalotiopsis fici (strain W106-1 / CGMCC3.15140) TaxID=1229662 RepID=W3X923_PESFW|nr:uncharacterized protein PFICI_06673 [Pestalotiopsis fici W106-1]ETS81671.1 hypothetical protein PFICI_06673 [Pestalotiopsis fici W106-1]